MQLFQLTGLSGSGKTTLAFYAKDELMRLGHKVEVIDGDEYRKYLSPDLGFSQHDRQTHLRRLGFVSKILVRNGIVVILAVINPYEEIRKEIIDLCGCGKTIWINCEMATLLQRDTKGLYRRSLLPDNHPDKLKNLTGINDTYEVPQNPDLVINTHIETLEESKQKFIKYILNHI